MILLRTIFIISILLVPVQILAQAKVLGEKQISFTVPEAPWNFVVDAEGYTISDAQVKPDGKYAYFLLTNDKTHLTFSLWIEPAIKCKTSEECRDMIFRAGNPMWQNLENIVQSKIGDISYFEFYRKAVQGQPVRIQDMYAEFVVDGYWIDLHISKPLYEKKDYALFENLVKSAKFQTKPKNEVEKSEPVPEAAKKALDAWLLIWDAGKYEEAYAELSTAAQANTTKRTWFVYWTGARKPLGKVKTRLLLRSDYIKSLPGAPGREGATFQYKGSFENDDSVIENIGLIRETDGTWRVATYLAN